MPGDGAPGEALRLFVAVELPDAARRSLAGVIDALRPEAGGALRWVRPEGVHVTLKFLGATPAARAPAISRALDDVAAREAPFSLQPSAVGSFGGRRDLRVVWVGVSGDTARLAGLAGAVEDALAPLSFARERRPFSAHLTLARVRDDAPAGERERLHAMLARYAPPAFPAVAVERISLMRSTLARGGAQYSAVSTHALRGPRDVG